MASSNKTPPTPVRLIQWPLLHELCTACWILGASVGFSILAGIVTGSFVVGGICMVTLSIAAWRCWIPVHYDLGPGGVTQRAFGRQLLFPWSQFVHYEVNGDLIVLIRDSENSLLFSCRSVYLYVGSQRGETLVLLEHYLVAAASTK